MNSLAMNVMLCVHGQATTQYFHTFHHVFQTCCVAVSDVSLCGSLSHLKADLLNESQWGNYLESELDEETDFSARFPSRMCLACTLCFRPDIPV